MRNNLTILIMLIFFWASCSEKGDPSQNAQSADQGTLQHYPSVLSHHVQPRDITVWLPPNYNAHRKNGYPVLYMHDGQNLFDTARANFGVEWQVDETMAKLIKAGAIPPTIVVGIHSTNERGLEYMPEKPFKAQPDSIEKSLALKYAYDSSHTEVLGDKYLQFIVEELMPFINQQYHTDASKAATFIAGSSMGGLISLYALATYPEKFAGAACLSTHWSIAFEKDSTFTIAYRDYLEHRLATLRDKQLYFDYGTTTLDSLYEPNQAIIDTFLAHHDFSKENWVTRKYPGHKHHESSWAKRFDEAMRFLID